MRTSQKSCCHLEFWSLASAGFSHRIFWLPFFDSRVWWSSSSYPQIQSPLDLDWTFGIGDLLTFELIWGSLKCAHQSHQTSSPCQTCRPCRWGTRNSRCWYTSHTRIASWRLYLVIYWRPCSRILQCYWTHKAFVFLYQKGRWTCPGRRARSSQLLSSGSPSFSCRRWRSFGFCLRFLRAWSHAWRMMSSRSFVSFSDLKLICKFHKIYDL